MRRRTYENGERVRVTVGEQRPTGTVQKRWTTFHGTDEVTQYKVRLDGGQEITVVPGLIEPVSILDLIAEAARDDDE